MHTVVTTHVQDYRGAVRGVGAHSAPSRRYSSTLGCSLPSASFLRSAGTPPGRGVTFASSSATHCPSFREDEDGSGQRARGDV